MIDIEKLAIKYLGGFPLIYGDKDILEAFAKAYLNEWLKEQDVVAYNHHFIQDDDFMPEEVLSHHAVIPVIIGCKYAGKTVRLIALPSEVK